ncbi:hypothetical protein SpCBS45565_g07966 [Spizellomyces sp. 'palustris']|nr:hypothetical protein SpCBS45565_g07966 [Spizellomyces sp. 'palustris']
MDGKKSIKRKNEEEETIENIDSASGEEDLDQDTVDVDFEFFDPKPIDFHGLKSLLRQTFSNDAELINISSLADIIISQPAVGSTVKVDDEQDPYALMTVINLDIHKDKDCVKDIKGWLLDKSKKNDAVHERMVQIVEKAGLIFNERLINMPPQIVPPMLKMLLEEMEWAVEDGEPFRFEYYIYISKVYKEIESTLAEEDGVVIESSKKGKKKRAKTSIETSTFYFQPEDEIIQEHAEFSFDFKFAKEAQSSDSRRAFQEYGIDPLRRVFVIKEEKIKAILEQFESILSA